MGKLQKANLGQAPSGAGGDDQRAANARFNANVDVLQACVPIEFRYLDDDAGLQASDVGARFIVSMRGPGKTVTLPLASTVQGNGCLYLVNNGPPLNVACQAGDGTQIRTLNSGDWAGYVSDSVKYWHVAERGRMQLDETIGGSLAVSKGLTVGGPLSVLGGVAGDLAASGKVVGFNSANLVVNGSGELGNTGWTGSNFGWSNGAVGEGRQFINAAPIVTSGYALDFSDNVPCSARVPVTVSAEIATTGLNSGQVYVRVEAFNAENAQIGWFGTPPISAKRGYTFVSASWVTPEGTAYLRLTKGADNGPNISQWGAAFRRIKLEGGSVPSLYSQEASIAYLAGAPTLSGVPKFGSYVPWHSGNLDVAKFAQLSGADFSGGVGIKSDSGAQFKGTATALSGTSNGAINDGTAFNSVHGPLDRQAFFTFREYYNQSANALIAVRAGTDWRNFHFRMDGNGYCQGNWVNGSDERVKSNIEPIEDALSKMRSIRGCTWDRLDGVSCGMGFIAQEVQKVFPEHVRVAEPTRTLDDGTTIKDFLSIDTGGIAAALHHQAILELMDEVEGMRRRIKELESKVSV
ncbi:tail fiber domain-containing protein [Burkholderia sp. LMG 13014]|uniref:tail fiber domain-containing protein n=1 Tax=Burkholderia sp. LMG 13014 TaxID=2709306 RepID=UPI0019649B91|nr:tail fiber domain-containing protein [Burkholderia sp. LMG 13014]